jgi:Fe-S-cluster containining protein
MNRRERKDRRKRARDEKQRASRAPKAPARATGPVAAPPPRDPLTTEVEGQWGDGRTDDAAARAATLAADAMDDRLTVVWSQTTLAPACARGCSYCCSVRVSVTLPEVIRVVAHARALLPADDLARIEARAQSNAARTHGTPSLGYPPRLGCAFLGDDGACRVYDARPLMCRREHAIDAAQCKAGYDLAAPGRDHPIDRLIQAKVTSDVVLGAYRAGLSDAGVDSSAYELQEAAHIAFSDPGAIAGWLAGEPAFARARLNTTAEPGPRGVLPVVR